MFWERNVREMTRNVGGEVFFGVGFLAIPSSRRLAVLLARYSGGPSHSQAFSVIPSQSHTSQSFPVVL